MKCTWKECGNKGRFQKKDIGGSIYADLCGKHNRELNQAIESGDHRVIFKAYVEAQGLNATESKGIPCPDPTSDIPPPVAGMAIRTGRK